MSGMTEHIEKLILDGTKIAWHEERVRDWLARGAQPTDTVRKLLRIQGIQ